MTTMPGAEKKPFWDKKKISKKKTHLTPAEKNRAKRWAKEHHVPYPSLVANCHAKGKGLPPL